MATNFNLPPDARARMDMLLGAIASNFVADKRPMDPTDGPARAQDSLKASDRTADAG